MNMPLRRDERQELTELWHSWCVNKRRSVLGAILRGLIEAAYNPCGCR